MCLEAPEIAGLEEKTPLHVPEAALLEDPLLILPAPLLVKAAIPEMNDGARYHNFPGHMIM